MPPLWMDELPDGRLGLPGAVAGLGLDGGPRLLFLVVLIGDVNALERACRPMAGLPTLPDPRGPRLTEELIGRECAMHTLPHQEQPRRKQKLAVQ
jgi:hypothetical protein